MPALFPPWANTAYGLALAAVALLALAALIAPLLFIRTSYADHVGQGVTQPIEFDHRHHARDDAIDCRYCHAGVEREAAAGLPSTALCMGCHGQIWPDSPLLAPVRASAYTGTPIRWRRVNALPDHVYFHHGVHVHGGVACAACHGDVTSMARVYRSAPLTMTFCLRCHRRQTASGAPSRAVTPLTTCSACHR